MQPRESSNSPGNNQALGDKLRSKLLEHALLAVPIAVVNVIVLWIKDGFFSQPWQILWFAVPLAVLAVVAWWFLTRHRNVMIGKWYFLLFAIFILIFSLASGSELLNWSRSLEGYRQSVPTNFLSLNWLGDWRYWFVEQTEPDADFGVVFMPAGETPEAGRVHVAQLLSLAASSGVKGVAFDFHFRDNTQPKVDEKLCNEINNAQATVPIFLGHGFERQDGEIVFKGVAPNLQSCVRDSSLGHTVAYAEFDNKIRLVPLYFKNISSRESLSLKIARVLEKGVQLPAKGLVQFIKPTRNFPEFEFYDLPQKKDRLHDKFLLVGERKDSDTWPTPYGPLPGVTIHSYVVHSLRHHQFLERTSWWSSLMMVFVACFLTVVFFSQGWSSKRIALLLLLVSVAICLMALIAARFWLVWLDVIYPLLAMWLFFLLLLALSKVSGASKLAAAS
jgi:CHASE2 domain-containing sensor protein